MILKIIEKVFVIVSLLLYSGAIAPFIIDSSPLALVETAMSWFAPFIALLLIAQRWKQIGNVILRRYLLWLLTGLIVGSALWSQVPMTTVELVMPFLRVTIFGVYFGTCFTITEQIRLLAWAFGLAALLSAITSIAFPKYGIVGQGFIANMEDVAHTGVWRGVYIHKNILGTMMVLGALTFLFCSFRHNKHQWISWIGLSLCIGVLQMSTNKSALVAFLIVLFLVPFYRAIRWKTTAIIPFFSGVLLAVGVSVALLLSSYEQILSALGRDVTISGRTIYWPLMLSKAWEHPWLGYGYKTFWLGGWKGEPADIWRFLLPGDEPPHAHNGFINLWLSIGLVGLGIFVLNLIVAYVQSISWVRKVKTLEGIVPLCYLTLMILLNLTESLLIEPDIIWLLYVSILLSLHGKTALLPDRIQVQL